MGVYGSPNLDSPDLHIQPEQWFVQKPENVCRCCHQTFSGDYSFCPYCGTRVGKKRRQHSSGFCIFAGFILGISVFIVIISLLTVYHVGV